MKDKEYSEEEHKIKIRLIPILRELGQDTKAFEKYRFFGEQVIGICIAQIKLLKAENKKLKKDIKQMKAERQADAQTAMSFIKSLCKKDEPN